MSSHHEPKSEAADELAVRQQEHPPWVRDANGAPVDRVIEFYHSLKPTLPKWAIDMYDAGALVVGEEGLHLPDAYRKPFSDGSHAIVLTSGYLNLFHAVASDLMAGVTHLSDGTKLEPLLSPSDTVLRIASLLWQFRSGFLFDGHALDTYSLELSPNLRRLAHRLAMAAGLFAVAHELGHVGAEVNTPNHSTKSEERDADIFAFTLLLAAAPRVDLGESYAGALFSLQLHACLERAGLNFSDLNVSLTERVAALKGGIRTSLSEGLIKPTDFAWIEVVLDLFLTPVEKVLPILDLTAESRKLPATSPKKSKAVIELHRLQDAHPPWEINREGNPIDRATKWLYPILEPELPIAAREMYASGDLVIGEVGLEEPVASLRSFDDGSQMIMLNSGLLSMLDAVARFLHTRVVVRLSDRDVGTVVSYDDALFLIRGLFLDLNRGQLGRGQLSQAVPGFWLPSDAYAYPGFHMPSPLEQEQWDFAGDLSMGAAAFILLSQICAVIQKRYEVALDQVDSGVLATMLFPAWVPWLGFRKTYAAALFAARFLSCIECNTPKAAHFSLTPAQVSGAPWRLGYSEAAFQYMSKVGEAYDNIMATVEESLCQRGSPMFPDGGTIIIDKEFEEKLWARDCIAWRLGGGIYACVKGGETREHVLEQMKGLTGKLNEQALQEVADSLFDRVLLQATVGQDLPDYEMTQEMREILDWLIERLPPNSRLVFEEVRKKKIP